MLAKAIPPISSILFPKLMVSSDEHLTKEAHPTFVTPLGIVILVRAEQSAKELVPIILREEGKEIELILEHFEKALSAISLVPFFIVIFPERVFFASIRIEKFT